MQLHLFLALLVLLANKPNGGAAITVESTSGGTVALSSANGVLSSVTLTCLLRNAPMLGQGLDTDWIIRNKAGVQRIPSFVSRNGYVTSLLQDEMRLTISSLSHVHEGNYSCQARDDPFAIWTEAIIELTLNLKLDVTPYTLFADNTTTSVELRCEMSEYIKPDESLQWFRHGETITGDDKYNISYENGNKSSQMGGSDIQESRVSVLVISDFQEEEDAGFYHCNVTGTSQSEAVFISLGEPDPREFEESDLEGDGNNDTTSTMDPASDGDTELDVEEESDDDEIIEGVPKLVLIIAGSAVGAILLSIALIICMVCCVCCWKYHKRDKKGEASDTQLWQAYPPALPKRNEDTKGYYVNEGLQPQTSYISLGINESYVAKESWQLDSDTESKHAYENPDMNDYDHIPPKSVTQSDDSSRETENTVDTSTADTSSQ